MSAQRTSCQNFFSSPLYVHEFFLARWSCARIFFVMHIPTCRIFFFKITHTPPPPPQKLNGRPLSCHFLWTKTDLKTINRYCYVVNIQQKYILSLCRRLDKNFGTTGKNDFAVYLSRCLGMNLSMFIAFYLHPWVPIDLYAFTCHFCVDPSGKNALKDS